MTARTLATFPALALAALLGACGSDPVSVSRPVGISLPVSSNDVGVAGAIAVDKNINTESGNPYGAFANAARDGLGGRNPSRVAVVALALGLRPSSTNVTALEQAFTGTVAISFRMNGSDAVYPVGFVASPAGTAAGLSVSFDSQAMPPADYDALLGGQFKVVLSGTGASGFSTASALADLLADFTFVAYE